jgi:hypothetical protein
MELAIIFFAIATLVTTALRVRMDRRVRQDQPEHIEGFVEDDVADTAIYELRHGDPHRVVTRPNKRAA